MKITKRQLRRIIKEEKQRLLKEMTPGDMGIAAARMDAQSRTSGNATDALGNLHAAIDQLISALGNDEAYLELQGIVDEWDTGTH